MNLKRAILLVIFALQLSVAAGQGKLVFTPAEWDFGTIREADGRVTHVFTGRNTGDKPLAILEVATSCGCTVPEFSRQPVLPGDTTRIAVTFDPANRPGTFLKQLSIFSTERRRIATLTICGKVLPREKSIEELFPVEAGAGVRLAQTMCAFSYVYPGRPAESDIDCINTSDRTIRLELRPLNSSGILTAECPPTLAPGERSKLRFTYRNPAAAPRYGTLRDAFALAIDDRESNIRIVAHGIGADNPKDISRSAAPKVRLSKNILKFGPVKHAAPEQRMEFVLTNEGTAPLHVRAVELNGKIGCSLRAGSEIPAGESRTVEVTLDPGQQSYGVVTGHILLITDDPSRPMRKLRVTAIIEQ